MAYFRECIVAECMSDTQSRNSIPGRRTDIALALGWVLGMVINYPE